MSSFPSAIFTPRTMDNLPGVVYDPTKTKEVYAEDQILPNDEIIAIESTLGVNPQGAYATVGARIAALEGGGGGFTTLDATETPNGVLTVFTFATATAEPSYIIADNVWFKKTSKAGTVNWTWDNTLHQATLTIPPIDEIWAVV